MEIGLTSKSPGNLNVVIPRALLDKVDSNGKDDSFGVIGNRAVGFEEISITPTSRTLVVQFEPGTNYIQILGTKSPELTSKIVALGSTNDLKTFKIAPKITATLNEPLTANSSSANKTATRISVINNTTLETPDIPQTLNLQLDSETRCKQINLINT